ncbi:MAG: cytochrome c [Terracidiphilus sp.]|jgi:mono/diheme cytochrome c family protein
MRLSVFVAAVLIVSIPANYAASRSQRERGAVVFAECGCIHCHSIRNAGGRKGPDLSGVGGRLKEAELRRQILQGGMLMPSFRDALQGAELADLIAYLRSCRDKQN